LEINNDGQDVSLDILIESARQAIRDLIDSETTFQFTERDVLVILESIWVDRFKDDLSCLKDACAALLGREGINENQ